MFKAILIISLTVLFVFIAFVEFVIIHAARDEEYGEEHTKDNSSDGKQELPADHT